MEKIMDILRTQGVKLLGGILVLVIGLFLVHWLRKWIRKRLEKSRMEPTVKSFAENAVRLVL